MEVKDPTGRLIPTPHYYLETVGYPIATVFYYTMYEEVEDLDGTVLEKPTYLSFLETHDIDIKKYKKVTLTVEVNNPEKIEYSFYKQEDVHIDNQENRFVVNSGSYLNSSNASYRQFVYTLPYGDNLYKVDQTVIMQVDGNDVLRMGPFSYNLIRGKEGFNNEK